LKGTIYVDVQLNVDSGELVQWLIQQLFCKYKDLALLNFLNAVTKFFFMILGPKAAAMRPASHAVWAG
jgi:hypothetical protein